MAFKQNMSIMFLGTASGGGPSESRNCSSLACDFMDDLSLWLVDCAEGTQRQFQLQPQEGFKYRVNKVTKIFITHMHADHIMGIVPLLRNLLCAPELGLAPAYSPTPKSPSVELYGPAGLRLYVRQIMKMTLTFTASTYAVHELLTQDDPVTPCDLPNDQSGFDHNTANQNVMHVREAPGSDIRADEDGFWKAFVSGRGRAHEIVVDAGSIQHRDPCLGFVFNEMGPPNRKIVILGDTYDASQIIPLCINPAPTLLIHEATDAAIPAAVDKEGKLSKRIPEEVTQKIIKRGHSIPTMAGDFAKQVNTSNLVLNHISARFPAPRPGQPWEQRATIMKEIERQATEAWGSTTQSAVAAQDFLRITIPMSGRASFVMPPPASQARNTQKRPAPSSSSGFVPVTGMHHMHVSGNSNSRPPAGPTSAQLGGQNAAPQQQPQDSSKAGHSNPQPPRGTPTAPAAMLTSSREPPTGPRSQGHGPRPNQTGQQNPQAAPGSVASDRDRPQKRRR
ncbi:hypothetical protein FA15DRAFT_292579 [Coprinopsis marcescibilis]|uniref:Metallo-beta-lactamase domain-containing protein n=1 Tax=Coprinopsis marcescibilis TaxID=230819 RepID=A0A5C3L0A0_COPMA|nr:hypothetical protein FA15DRAFT_292579 [Coprinopsis marcescibilis]